MANELAGQVLRTDLGSYAVYADVASGGFGTVSFGRDLQSNRAVAIKRLHGHLAYQPAVVERFRQEAQRLRGLQHPNIVQVLDEGTDRGGLPFIILQWVEGWTVAALLEQKGRFPIAEAVEIACQVLAALEAAGQRGVVHRDIKPSNLMVTPPPDRQVKVMDFGIAKDLLADAQSQYTQIGTIAYMAPEQFSQARVDGRTDLYALGVTLYELLAGQRPSGALVPESLTSLRELRPEVDPALAAIVYRALEKRPMDRFQTAAEMHAALTPFVGREVDLTVLAAGSVVQHAAPPQAHLAELYATATQAFDAHEWPKAVELLEAVKALEPSYQGADALLADARRQQTLADLYDEARELHRAQAWPAVLNILERIHAQDAEYDDSEALGRTARAALAAEQHRHEVEQAQAKASAETAAITTVEELQSEQRVARTSEPPPSSPPVKRHVIGPQAADRTQRLPLGSADDGPQLEIAAPMPDFGRRAESERDGNAAGRRGRRRIGAPIWAGAAAALLAIAVVAQQVASGQTRQGDVPTPAPPVAQSTEVAPGPAVLALPTDVPPTATPRVAIPPTAVPTSAPTLTSTPAPTVTAAPTATPSVDDLWRATLVQLDPTWSRDWPEAIKLLNAFLAAHPGFPAGEDKLYAARLFYADELLAAGNLDGAVEQLDAANTLLPQRPQAKETLVALTPTPTATTPPAVFIPQPQQKPVAPAPAPRPAPAPPAEVPPPRVPTP